MAGTNDNYMRPTRSPEPKRKRNSLYRPLTFFLIVLAIVMAMSVFFKISRIEVEGNSFYTDDEIISASGIQDGDNLFFLNRIAAGSRIAVKLPYVDSVTLNRGLPNIVRICVVESRAVGCVDIDGVLRSIGSTGKCLGTVDRSDAGDYAVISGIALTPTADGGDFSAADGNEDKLAYLLDILYQIQARQLAGQVTAIDMTDVNDPVLEYGGRFIVKLGANDDTEYKFGKLLSAVSKLGADDVGILDLAEGNTVEYHPN